MTQYEVHVRYPKTERHEQYAKMVGWFTDLAQAIEHAKEYDDLDDCTVSILVIPSMLSYKGSRYITLDEAKKLIQK